MRFIQVILPLRIDWLPFYSTSDSSIEVGSRVEVKFAAHTYVGVVAAVDVKPNIPTAKVQPVLSHLAELGVISARELQLWQFISSYYLCSMGEVYKAAYPKQRLVVEQTGVRKLARLKASLERARAELAKARREDVRQRRQERVAHFEQQLAALEQGTAAPAPAAPAPKPLLLVCEDWQTRAERICAECSQAILSGGDVLLLAPGQPQCKRFSALFARLLKDSVPDWKDHMVFGTRAAVLNRADDISLIIVDQEQDRYYKQEASPLYNSRDVAVYLGSLYNARVILATDSPSLECVYNTRNGKYELETIPVSHTTQVDLVGISAETRKNGMLGIFSRKLVEAVNLVSGPVTIVRGFEKEEDVLAAIAEYFPGREDIRVISYYAARRDEQKSALTALLQADFLFSKDDFRADERALQDLQHLKQNCDSLFVQAFAPDHQVLKRIAEGNAFEYDSLLAEREQFSMPPYSRAVDIVIDDDNTSRRDYLCSQLLPLLVSPLQPLGPMPVPYQPSELRIRFFFEHGVALRSGKQMLKDIVDSFAKEKKYFGYIRLDVDPS